MIESLEDRRLLNVDWRNPVDSIDVDNDGSVSPLDALVVINYINAGGSGRLPAVHDLSKPYLDVDGDQSVSPLDVLNVINYLNVKGSGVRSLSELAGQLVGETDVTITLGQLGGTRHYRVRLDSQFDTSDRTSGLEDLLAVYLVDPKVPNTTLLSKGENGTALFTLAGTKADYALGRVRWDGSILDIDLSDLQSLDTGLLKFQLLSSDSDFASRISIKPLTNEVDLEATSGPLFQSNSTLVAKGAALNLSGLSTVSNVIVEIGDVRFNSGTGKYVASIRLRNNGDAVGRDVAVVFPGLPATVSLRNASGTTTAGEPYVNMKPAITRGGLGRGMVSDSVEIEFSNSSQIQFAIKTRVLANTNHAPTLEALGPLNVSPGGFLKIPLVSADSDGDDVTYSTRSVGAASLPTGTLIGDTLIFRPAVADIGSYMFDVIASDGAMEMTRSVTLNIVADPIATTRVSGRVLQVNGQPLTGMLVEIGAVQGLTSATGEFTLDLGSGPIVSDTIKIRGERFAGGGPYPFIAEKLQLLLEHPTYAKVNNIIDRPIYLPALDVAHGTVVDPTRDTFVRQEVAPGETAEIFVAAGTLMNLLGTPFTGTLSITEVPTELTPAALPKGLSPDLVVTIQPGEMVFARPAPLSLPNRAGWSPGFVMDLWSINPVTGEFEDVGDMQVSTDGKSIDTIAGGVRNSSWHAPSPPPQFGSSPSRGRSRTGELGCNACKLDAKASSTVEQFTGSIIESHDLQTYQSLGVARGVRLVYDSVRADVQPIFHLALDNVDLNAFRGFELDRLRYVAQLTIKSDKFDFIVPGAKSNSPFGHYAGGDDLHFWRLPDESGPADAALQVDMRQQPTGVYTFEMRSGLYSYFDPRCSGTPCTPGPPILIGSSTRYEEPLVVVNEIASPFGAGWGIAGLQRVIEGVERSVLIIDGDGSELLFRFDTKTNKYITPAGDFSTLHRANDGSFRRTMPDQLVSQFDTAGRLVSEADRNHNVTIYTYDGQGRLTTITDPVGLVTTFAYIGAKLSSITDPAGRQTTFQHDAIGNLIRVTDPDSTSRNWGYDAQHHIVSEVDKLGRRETTEYGPHGRATGGVHKDGSRYDIHVPQAEGLLPAGSTFSLFRAKPMFSLSTDVDATYVDGNGNVQRSKIDAAGQPISRMDAIGSMASTQRDASNLPQSTTDARGFATNYTFDSRGNMLTALDSLSIRQTDDPGNIGIIAGTIQYYGEFDRYTFEAQAGERLWVDRVRGAQDFRIKAPSGVALSDSQLLAETGKYQVEVANRLGDYAINLLSLTHSPALPLATQIAGISVAGQDLVYRVSLRKDQKLQVEDRAPNNTRTWQLKAADDAIVYFNREINSPLYDFIAPRDGEYYVILWANPGASLDPIPFNFIAYVTDPNPFVAFPKSGFGVTHSGTVRFGEEAKFPISGPKGTLLYLDFPGGVFQGGTFSLRSADGQSISLAGSGERDKHFSLPRSGTYEVVVTNNAIDPQDFSFRIIDLAESPRLSVGETIKRQFLNGSAVTYRLAEPAGRRLITHAEPDNADEYVPAELSLISGATGQEIFESYSGFNEDSVLTLTDGGDYFLVADSFQQFATLDWTTMDARLAKPTALDQDIRGTLTPNEPRKYFRFTAKPGSTIYLENLGDAATTTVKIIGLSQLGDSAFVSLTVPSTGLPSNDRQTEQEYIIIVTTKNSSTPLPTNFSFRIHDFHTSESTLTVGQSVIGKLDWSERDTIKFEGKAGQVLYFDSRTNDTNVDEGMTQKLIAPDGGFFFSYSGRGTDFGPFTLPLNGTYRIVSETTGNNLQPVHHEYQFRLVDLHESPFVSLNSPLARSLPNGATVSAYQFAGMAGQRIRFDQLVPATTSLRMFSRDGKLMLDTGDMNSAFATFVDTGLYYLLVNGRDPNATTPVSYRWTISDASEPAVTPSGFGIIREGTAAEDEVVATFQANAGTRVLLLQASSFSVPEAYLKIEGPSGEVVANGIYLVGDYSIILPRSGQYALRVVRQSGPISIPVPYKLMLSLGTDIPPFQTETLHTIPVNEDFASAYRLQANAERPMMLDVILPDDYNDASNPFFGWSRITAYDVATTPLQYLSSVVDEVFTTPRNGNYVFRLRVLSGQIEVKYRLRDLSTVPRIALNSEATGTVSLAYENAVVRFAATAAEKRLFRVDTPNWVVVNAKDPKSRVNLKLSEFDVGTGPSVWQGVATFPTDGDYFLVRHGAFGSPLTYSALMTQFEDAPIAPLIGGTFSLTRNTYDSTFSQMTSNIDEQERQTVFEIDPVNGNTRSATRVVGQVGGTDDLISTFTFTATGQVDTATDPLGRVTDFDYDIRGNLIQVTSAKGTAVQAIQQFNLDAAGNVIANIDANGHRTTYENDSMNRRTRMTAPDPDGTGPLLAAVTLLTYDGAGNVTAVTDAAGHATSQTYDTRDRIIAMTDTNQQVTRYGYDQNGNVIASTDPLGRVTKMQYDARNRLIASIDAAGFVTRYRYDLDDNLLSVTDASGNLTRYDYDARGRRVAEVDPLGSVSTFVYNGMNELVTMTDRLGRVTKMDFDDVGRLTRERWLDAANTLVNTIDTTFDAASRPVRMQDGTTDLRVTFDELDRVTRNESGGVAGVPAAMLDATYDIVGNRLTLTDTIQGSIGARNTYLYDAMDRLTRETQVSAIGATNLTAEKRVDFKYNVLSQATSIARFSDLAGTLPIAASQFTYDTLNRLTDLTHRNAANVKLNGFAFTYDATSRITRITDIDGTTDYAYDSRDQLTGANHADAANPDETYAYDGTGNRTASQRHGSSYVVGDGVSGTADNNRLTSDGTYRYAYDAEGNLLTRTQIAGGAVREFAWDHRNRLIRITDRPSVGGQPTQLVEFTYDALNRRIAKEVDAAPADAVDGAITYFIYDESDVLAEFFDSDGSGPALATKSMRYLHGPDVDHVLAQEDVAGNIQWMLADHLGTVRDLVNNSGTVVNHLKYDTYGNVVSESNPSFKTRYRFTGRELDSETGLQYNRARYYVSASGLFLSEDPAGFAAGDANLYRYVGNSPTNFVDSTGLAAEDCSCQGDVFTAADESLRNSLAAFFGSPERLGAGFITGFGFETEYGVPAVLKFISKSIAQKGFVEVVGLTGSQAAKTVLIGGALNSLFAASSLIVGLGIGSGINGLFGCQIRQVLDPLIDPLGPALVTAEDFLNGT